MITGIDSSRWQGRLPVYELEEAGIEFVYLKAVHGASKNPDGEFSGNWERLSNTRMLKSAYGWFTDADPNEQAEAFIRIVEKVGECDLPLAADFEEPTTIFRGNQLADRFRTYLRRLRELSGQPKLLLYSGKWYIDQYLAGVDIADLVDENYYWHAEYPRVELRDKRQCGLLPPTLRAPSLPSAWVRAGVKQTLWQWDGNGGCVLPNGVDADFNQFDGDLARLKALLPNYSVSDTLPAGPIEYISPTVTLAEEYVKTLADDLPDTTR